MVHNIIGHVSLFAIEEFVELSQQIELESLGISDADIKKLAACYLYTIELGLVAKKIKR